ncbi:PaaI family thioesterase [Tropicimonas marinistellae]|uniref:PaaI family thioesterase n=1 Tax=Tropicimonas marinistellae TaxID=1739787 RepID=UPI000830E6A0|nr:PaaI family thioesterase [Tropicimonas marinistellae]
MSLMMTAEELDAFISREFPQVVNDFHVEDLREDGIRVRMQIGERHLRPGGTVSGPSMFSLVDVSIYLAVLSRIGPVALAVTTNCSIDFMRKPVAGRDLLCDARLLKLGRQLAVGDALIFSEGATEPVARAGVTYAIPPRR